MASVDYFLKVDGIDGESTDVKHKDELDIESFSWGLSNPGSAAHAAGHGGGKPAFEDFSFVSPVSKASPQLFLAAATGIRIKSAILTARKAGREQQEFMKIVLSDLLVSRYEQHTAPDILPTDQFSFNFAKIEYEYRPQRDDDSQGGVVSAGYDLKSNKKV